MRAKPFQAPRGFARKRAPTGGTTTLRQMPRRPVLAPAYTALAFPNEKACLTQKNSVASVVKNPDFSKAAPTTLALFAQSGCRGQAELSTVSW